MFNKKGAFKQLLGLANFSVIGREYGNEPETLDDFCHRYIPFNYMYFSINGADKLY